MKELHCRDAGFDCKGIVRADTEDEVMRQAAEHARTEHGVQQLSAEQQREIRSKIRNA